jgi:hypothetical protein
MIYPDCRGKKSLTSATLPVFSSENEIQNAAVPGTPPERSPATTDIINKRMAQIPALI